MAIVGADSKFKICYQQTPKLEFSNYGTFKVPTTGAIVKNGGQH
jgi:hypothetical protein